MRDDNNGDQPRAVIDTVVVGGGVAGLVAATTAARAGGTVVLLENHPLGGRARVDERDGFRFNRGPRALYLAGAAKPVLDQLGVDTSAGGPPPGLGAQARRDGRLHLLPQDVRSLFRTTLLGPADKLAVARLLATFAKLDPRAVLGSSFGAFLAERRLRPVSADLVRMLARVATYAAEPDEMDAGAVVAQMQLALGAGVRYLDGGFQTIVDQLTQAALDAGVERRADAASSVRVAWNDGPASVTTSGGPILARTVVMAVGTPAATEALLGAPIGGTQGLTAPVTAACLELGLRRPPTTRVVFGVGEPLYLSTHYPPAQLGPPGHAIVHVMRNHTAHEELDARAQRDWLRAAAAQAGITDEDVVADRFLAEMVVTGGMPTGPGGGLPGRPTVASADRPGVLLAGDWVGPDGLLVDAAAASGAEAGRQAAARAATMAVV